MKVLLIAAVVLVIVVMLLRRQSSAGQTGNKRISAKTTTGTSGKKSASRSAPRPAKPFRSTSIKCGPGACEAARALAGQRLLIDQVPRLPLADCTAEKCDCRYTHHEDRREPRGERRALAGLSTELYAQSGKEERRAESKKTGRRDGDNVESE